MAKRRRKNMNLSEEVFRRLNLLRKEEEKRAQLPIPWDNFFSRLLERLRRVGE